MAAFHSCSFARQKSDTALLLRTSSHSFICFITLIHDRTLNHFLLNGKPQKFGSVAKRIDVRISRITGIRQVSEVLSEAWQSTRTPEVSLLSAWLKKKRIEAKQQKCQPLVSLVSFHRNGWLLPKPLDKQQEGTNTLCLSLSLWSRYSQSKWCREMVHGDRESEREVTGKRKCDRGNKETVWWRKYQTGLVTQAYAGLNVVIIILSPYIRAAIVFQAEWELCRLW